MTDTIDSSTGDSSTGPAAAPADVTPSGEVAALLARCEEAGRERRPLERVDALAVLRLSDEDTVAAVASAGRAWCARK